MAGSETITSVCRAGRGSGERHHVMLGVNPGSALNSYWQMPFRKSARITMQNLDDKQMTLQVTIQALGWRADGRYLPLQDDIASVAFWYQAEPHAPFPKLPGRDALEVNWAGAWCRCASAAKKSPRHMRDRGASA